jgi:hypothetical protein
MDMAVVGVVIGAQMAQTQFAFAAKMMKMNAAAQASVAQLVEAGSRNIDALANVAAGIGGNLDVSV